MEMKPLSGRRRAYDRILKTLLALSALATCALLVFLIAYIFIRGLPHVTWELLSTKPSYLKDTIGILPNIVNTVFLVSVTLLLVLPLGVGAAVYLTEYARGRRLVRAIEFATETLAGIPSIIYGLVGMLFFCKMCIRDRAEGGVAHQAAQIGPERVGPLGRDGVPGVQPGVADALLRVLRAAQDIGRHGAAVGAVFPLRLPEGGLLPGPVERDDLPVLQRGHLLRCGE